jgi:hypothetical protein
MLLSMRRPNPSSGWLRVLALPLALWSAVPGVQWCPVGWAEVSLECFAECTIERPTEDKACSAVAESSPAACDGSARGCTAGVAECGLAPCGADDSGEPPGGRAYCLSGPLGGDGIPPVPLDASPPLATLPVSDWSGAPAEEAERPAVREVARPPTPATGAVPRIRAPPEPGSTTC